MVIQEIDQRQDIAYLGRERGGGVDLIAETTRAVAPASQAFELQPTDAIEAIGDGVLDRPLWLALGVSASVVQLQIVAQGWHRLVLARICSRHARRGGV